jgi:undecaprenyl-diphosphatase
MSYLHAILIAVLQGATELFPVSSLGHAVIVPALLGWHFDQHAPVFLPFLVLLHLGTAAALLGYFWRDWWELAIGVLGLADPLRVRESRHIFVLLVIATLPAAILGAGLEHFIRRLFETPLIACIFLALNGILLLVGERLRRRVPQGASQRPLATLSAADAVIVGAWQCLALIPGISRSGATITGGLLRGLDHAASAHFSFLIATPVILGATVLEVPKLLHANVPPGTFTVASVAAIVAGLVALASTAFLMRYFRHNDKWALDPFAYYCIIAGVAAGAWLYIH